MVDSVYRTRSLGVAAEGLPDQYADGKAAAVWEFYIGGKQKRTAQYKEWLVGLLRAKNCRTVLDVACGTGVDSMLLIDEGFKVFSTDASDKMLKYALKERWTRRKDAAYDQWIIEEANWLTLAEDIEDVAGRPEHGFDAVICLGNSFAHLPDFEGKLANQKAAIRNFKAMLKPGGLLLIDHRNYDYIVETGSVHAKNVYYNSNFITDIKCSTLFVNAKPTMVTLDYEMDMTEAAKEKSAQGRRLQKYLGDNSNRHQFRLSYYPHRLKEFTEMLNEVFSANCSHETYADFKPVGEVDTPAYYIHVVTKRTD